MKRKPMRPDYLPSLARHLATKGAGAPFLVEYIRALESVARAADVLTLAHTGSNRERLMDELRALNAIHSQVSGSP